MTSLKSHSEDELKKLIEEVLALDEKATEGPWAVNPLFAQVDACAAGTQARKTLAPVCQMLWPTDVRTEEETEANSALIAHYRTAAPVLARALTAATKRLEEADALLVYAADQFMDLTATFTAEKDRWLDDGIEAARSRLARQQGEQR